MKSAYYFCDFLVFFDFLILLALFGSVGQGFSERLYLFATSTAAAINDDLFHFLLSFFTHTVLV